MNNDISDKWPFDQPRNCATFTMGQVMKKTEPILRVTHNEDDHCWQFIGKTDASMEDAMLVSLEEIVKLDPSVLEVADLQVGWRAIRAYKGGPWKKIRQEVAAE